MKKLFIVTFYPNGETDSLDVEWFWNETEGGAIRDFTKYMKSLGVEDWEVFETYTVEIPEDVIKEIVQKHSN